MAGNKAGSPGGKPQRRREELIDAAVRVFANKGYEATSTQEIAEELGVLKGSIYYYIDSKEDLLFSVVQSVHDDMGRNLDRAKARTGAVEERIRGYFEDLLRLTIDRLDYSTVFYNDFRRLSEEHQSIVIKRRDEYERYLVDLLREGQRSGAVRDDVDSKLMALSTLTMATLIYRWYKPGGSFTPDEVVEGYSRVVMSGLGCVAQPSAASGPHPVS
jgi:TetR/AcrR family transcriptional regulator, cholesterol catabolism regulator